MPNTGMSFGFMGPMPNMYNQFPYQNSIEQNSLYEIEKRLNDIENRLKELEKSMPKTSTYNYNYDYKTSMNMM